MEEMDDGLELRLTLGFSENRYSLNLTPKSSRNEAFLPSSGEIPLSKVFL